MGNVAGMQQVYEEVSKPATFTKVDITVHNVYGWAHYYYQHAAQHGQQAKKKAFFEDLKTLAGLCMNMSS